MMSTNSESNTIKAVEDATDRLHVMEKEEVFYWVYVCREHAKGKIGYLAPENRCPNCKFCQVNPCMKPAEWIVSIGEA